MTGGEYQVLGTRRLITFIALGLLAACLPSSPSGGRKSAKSASVGSPAASPVDFSTTTGDSTLYWYSEANYISGALTIDANISTSLFLRGVPINDYLKT